MKKSLWFSVVMIVFFGLMTLTECSESDEDFKEYGDLFPNIISITPALPTATSATSRPRPTKTSITTTAKSTTSTKKPNSETRRAKICGIGKKCALYYKCNDLKVENDWNNLIDERSVTDDVEAALHITPCETLEVCCSDIDGETESIPEPTPAPTTSSTPYRNNTCEHLSRQTAITTATTATPRTTGTDNVTLPVKPKKNARLVEQFCKKLNTPLSCGVRNELGLGGLTKEKSGKTSYAQYGEFPWTVAIWRRRKIRGSGSLIHPKVVLTVYHVIQGTSLRNFKVRAGEWNTKADNEICDHEERNIARVTRHEDYDPMTNTNNVALLLLDSEFTLNSAVNTVCLPPAQPKYYKDNCWSVGWGEHEFDDAGAYQDYLKKVKLPLIDFDVCEQQFNNSGMMEEGWRLHEGFMCAGGGAGQDTFKGDGGAPLVCPTTEHEENYFLAGIVALSTKLDGDLPGIYIDVSHYRAWIETQFNEILKLSTAYYQIQNGH